VTKITERLEEIKRQCPPRFDYQTVDTQFYLSLIESLYIATAALEHVTKNEPEPGGKGACTFCDMGGSGYSSKGLRHHDDTIHICPVYKSEEALAEIASKLGVG
jgi:hypothetical protein